MNSNNPLAFWRWALHWQILLFLLVGFGLGIATGMATPDGTAVADRADFAAYSFIGKLFLNAMKLLIVPLIVSSLIVGVITMGAGASFARLGSKTVAYYLCTSVISIMIGLTLVNIIQPGHAGDSAHSIKMMEDAGSLDVASPAPAQGREALPEELRDKVGERSAGDFLRVFELMVPPNIFESATDNGKLLGLIVFSLIFGFYAARLEGPGREAMVTFWQAIYDVMLHITNLVLQTAPVGIGALIASTVADAYTSNSLADHFVSLAWFFATVVIGLSLHMFVVLPLLMYFLGKVKNPWMQYSAMGPAMLTAFSTSSSAATLPLTMRCVNERAGVSERISSFTLPLGATVNMDGTALYECVVVMYVAQLVGMDLSFGIQFMIVTTALLTSIGVAGVPSSSLVAIVLIMEQAGMSAHLDKLGLVMVVDRLLDMCRTTVNVFSDSVAAVIIARSEGETEVLTKPPEALGDLL